MKTRTAPQKTADAPQSATMKAIVFRGPGKPAWEDRPRPRLLAPTDAVVRMTTTTVCGSDLHILKGDVPEVEAGRILGHEGVGVIVEKGAGVQGLDAGDKVIVSCITSCALCAFCRRGMYSHCINGGWLLGCRLDGTQAEFVRVPYASSSLYKVPADCDEAAMAMLSDILPTGYEAGVLNGGVAPGATVVIVGTGPVGLAALLTARFFSPSQIIAVDLDENRVKAALALGATHGVAGSPADAAAKVLELTDGLGADVVIEAVGTPATFQLCQKLVAAGGTIANIGVHGKPVELHLETLWSRNIRITTRLVDTAVIPLLLKEVAARRLKPERLITHRLGFHELPKAYEIFSDAARQKALKVVASAVPTA